MLGVHGIRKSARRCRTDPVVTREVKDLGRFGQIGFGRSGPGSVRTLKFARRPLYLNFQGKRMLPLS
eukprot:4208155-Prorocentrum_lima.AAC.1